MMLSFYRSGDTLEGESNTLKTSTLMTIMLMKVAISRLESAETYLFLLEMQTNSSYSLVRMGYVHE